jgi:hypothetical protein
MIEVAFGIDADPRANGLIGCTGTGAIVADLPAAAFCAAGSAIIGIALGINAQSGTFGLACRTRDDTNTCYAELS